MSNELLPQPRLVLRLGALGNRKFGRDKGLDEKPSDLEEAAAKKCREALAAVREIVVKIYAEDRSAVFPAVEASWRLGSRNLFGWLSGRSDWWQRRQLAGQPASVFSEDRPLIQVLSGLAQGADRLVVKEACGPHGNNSGSKSPVFECVAVVVGEEGRAAREENFCDLRQCFSIGTIPAPLTPAANSPLPRNEAHRRADVVRRRAFGFRAQSEALRHHSDVLLAVWDPDTEGKAGGTLESVEEALRAGLPVLAVRFDPQGQATLDLLRYVEDLRQGTGSLGLGKLETCLRHILCFPDPSVARPETSHYSSYHPRVAFHQFLRGLPLPVAWTASLWPKLRALTESGYEPTPSPTRPSAPSVTLESPGTFDGHYAGAKQRASGLAEAFGDAHRGGIAWSYLLAAGAVLLALAGAHLHHVHASPLVLAVVAGLELLAILALWTLAETSAFEDWHEAYTDIRVLAEALRCMKYLGPLGVHTPIPKLPPHLAGSFGAASSETPFHDPRRLWSVWYFRALVRAAPLQLDAGSAMPLAERRTVLLEKWIGDPNLPPNRIKRGPQTEYHRRNRYAQHRLFHGLESLTNLAFVIVFGAALIHAGESLVEFLRPTHIPGEETGGGFLVAICFWVCVGGPALLAAINGFLSQVEAVDLRQRSEGMLLLLADRHRVLNAVDVDANPDSVEAKWRVAREAIITAGLLVDETAGWALIYKGTDIHAG